MPRPGPRPYECVRRSWHSDHHQPIRGSIIQQIFRVVNEIHSTGTKKNREWQQKLPKVVLKSEEIMYSKANSEAEYLNPETLWDRVNDAIDTIIKKDESMETGEFLPPCVEAALNLGCVPVKASRSQRNINTRSYLSPQNHEPAPKIARNLNLPNHERPVAVNQAHTLSESNRDARQKCPITAPHLSFYPSSIENFTKQTVSVDNKASLATSSVYPLYYGGQFHPQNPKAFHITDFNADTIIVGKPVFQKIHEPLKSQLLNHPETSFSYNGSKKTVREEPQECDLSLRLGLVSSTEKGSSLINGVDSGQTKEFCFFPLNSEGEQVQNLDADIRKRKGTTC